MTGRVAVLCIACFYNGVSSGNIEYVPSNVNVTDGARADGAGLSNVTDGARADGAGLSNVTDGARADGAGLSNVTDGARADGAGLSNVTDGARADGAGLSNVIDGARANGAGLSDVPDGARADGAGLSNVIDGAHTEATADTLMFVINTILSAFEATAQNNQGAASPVTAAFCPNNTVSSKFGNCGHEYDPFE